MVFQNYVLYPHMNVADNTGFALEISGLAKGEGDLPVRKAAKLLGLEDYAHRKSKALSEGQAQRVAMGRATVREPQVFCIDEPSTSPNDQVGSRR